MVNIIATCMPGKWGLERKLPETTWSAEFFLLNFFTDPTVRWKHYRPHLPGMRQYCDVPGPPCLSKTGPIVGPCFSIFGSLARVLSLPGAKVVCWRPHLAGTRQYIDMPRSQSQSQL